MSPEHVALQAVIDELVQQWREQSVDLTEHQDEMVPA